MFSLDRYRRPELLLLLISFTINHIAAVVIPAVFSLLWLVAPAAVFINGAAMAGISLLLSMSVPETPAPGNEVRANPAGLVSAALKRA